MKKIPEKLMEEKIKTHLKYISNNLNKAMLLIDLARYKISEIYDEINNLRKKI